MPRWVLHSGLCPSAPSAIDYNIHIIYFIGLFWGKKMGLWGVNYVWFNKHYMANFININNIMLGQREDCKARNEKIWSLASSPLIRNPVALRKSVRGWEQSLGVKCLPSMVYTELWVSLKQETKGGGLRFLSLKFYNQKSKFHCQLPVPFSDTQKTQLALRITFVFVMNSSFLPCVSERAPAIHCVDLGRLGLSVPSEFPTN